MEKENGKQGTDSSGACSTARHRGGTGVPIAISTGLPCATRTAVKNLEPSLPSFAQFWTLEDGRRVVSWPVRERCLWVDGIAGPPEMGL
jgi:hypothetical protein